MTVLNANQSRPEPVSLMWAMVLPASLVGAGAVSTALLLVALAEVLSLLMGGA